MLPFAALIAAAPAPINTPDPTIPPEVETLLSKYGCNACHSVKRKLVGPKWQDVGAKGYTKKRIAQLVKNPEPGNWPGYPPMAAQPGVPKGDMDKIATWIISLK